MKLKDIRHHIKRIVGDDVLIHKDLVEIICCNIEAEINKERLRLEEIRIKDISKKEAKELLKNGKTRNPLTLKLKELKIDDNIFINASDLCHLKSSPTAYIPNLCKKYCKVIVRHIKHKNGYLVTRIK